MTLTAVHRSARYFITPLGDHVRTLMAYDVELKRVRELITVSHPKPLSAVSGARGLDRRTS